MQPGQPSRTAPGAAAHRAVQQVLERGRIFADPLAPQKKVSGGAKRRGFAPTGCAGGRSRRALRRNELLRTTP